MVKNTFENDYMCNFRVSMFFFFVWWWTTCYEYTMRIENLTTETHLLPISPVVKRSVLVEHGQKQPNTYCLDPEDNEQEP